VSGSGVTDAQHSRAYWAAQAEENARACRHRRSWLRGNAPTEDLAADPFRGSIQNRTPAMRKSKAVRNALPSSAPEHHAHKPPTEEEEGAADDESGAARRRTHRGVPARALDRMLLAQARAGSETVWDDTSRDDRVHLTALVTDRNLGASFSTRAGASPPWLSDFAKGASLKLRMPCPGPRRRWRRARHQTEAAQSRQ
jgi:hypothetical protein